MEQYPRVIAANALPGMVLQLRFTDGSEGRVDVGARLRPLTGMLEALGDPTFFARVSVDSDAGTVVWPNGVDLDPDVLYAAAHGLPVPGQLEYPTSG